MKKWKGFNVLLVFVCLLLIPVSFSIAKAAEPIVTIKIAVLTNLPHGYSVTANEFKKRIEALTDGAIRVTVHPGGQLGGEYEYVQGMQLGTIDATVCATPSFAGIVREFEIFTLPFLFQDYAHADRVFQTDVGRRGAEILKKNGLVLLSWHESGFQGFYNSKRPIETINDIKGLTMRTMESKTIAAAMNAYGARSIPMAFPEFYGGMQTGVVDGGENGVHAYYVAKHYEVAKYYSKSNHRYLTSVFMISEKTMNKIPIEYHQAIKGVGAVAGWLGMQQGRRIEDDLFKKVVNEHGTQLNIISDEAKKDFLKAVQPLYKEVGNKVSMQKELDMVMKARK